MATYWRPSNRNIHRSKDAPETAEWGVHPDIGCEVKLEKEQIERMLEDRRRRDIVRQAGQMTTDVGAPLDLDVDPQLKRAIEELEQRIDQPVVASAH
jgi:carboxyl-terminal processing protease